MKITIQIEKETGVVKQVSENEITETEVNEPVECGVYRLINSEDNVIYIGSSKDIERRIRQHISKGLIDFTHFTKLLCTPEEMFVIERALINLYNPVHNKTRGRPKKNNEY